VATYPQTPADTEKADLVASPIENELPTYRAISPLAVWSLVFGLVGALGFANLWFLVFAALAIVAGVLGLRRIGEQPDVLTGRGFAQAGIGLGLVFMLSTLTIAFTQQFLLRRRAEAFVRNSITKVFNDRDLASALWFRETPDARREQTPEQVYKRINDPGNSDPMRAQMFAGPATNLINLLQSQSDAKVEFAGIERADYEGITPVALAVLEIKGLHHEEGEKAGHKHEAGEEFIGVVIKGQGDGRNEAWWVEDYLYPYARHSYQEKVKSIEEEHGHGH
jgi:hypothetical protein